MKKLMTMIAAAAMAFGLYAESTIDHTVNFTGLADGTYDLTQTDGKWGYSGDAATLQIKSEKLEIKTGSNALSRYFVGSDSQATIPADGLFFDASIDFMGQALDEVPTVGTDAKLGLFILNTADIEGIQPQYNFGTNLYLIGGYGSNGGKALYQLTTVVDDAFFASEHRVTIKAYDSALSTGARTGFMLYLDATATPLIASKVCVAGQDGKFNLNTWVAVDNIQGGYLGDVTVAPTLSGWANNYQLFLSMIADDDSTLASVDFTGNATIDYVTLTDQGEKFDFIPEDASVMDVELSDATLAAADVVGAIYDEKTGQITIPNGVTSFTIAPDFENEIESVKVDGDEVTGVQGVYTIEYTGTEKTIVISSPATAAYVNDEPYADFAEAFEAAKQIAGSTLKLNADVEEALEFDGESMILDLAGNTISADGLTDGHGVIFVSANALTITNSTAEVGAVIATGTDGIAVNNDSATVTIVGGKFDGLVQNFFEEGEATYDDIEASAGAFKPEPNAAIVAEGFMVGKEPDADGFYPIVPEPTYTATFEAGEGVDSLSYKVNAAEEFTPYTDTITGLKDGDTITLSVVVKTGYKDVDVQPYMVDGANIDEEITTELQEFTISFKNKDGGQIGDAQTVQYGQMPEAPTAPDVTGMSFEKWEPEVAVATEDKEYQAKYTNNVYAITYSYVDDKGDAVTGVVNGNPTSFEFGKGVASFDAALLTGYDTATYTFKEFSQVSIAADVAAPVTITVTFTKESGDWPTPPTNPEDVEETMTKAGFSEEVAKCFTTVESYTTLMNWAQAQGLTAAAVAGDSAAQLAFAAGAETAEDDVTLKIDTMAADAEVAGTFDLTIVVPGNTIVNKELLAKLITVQGATKIGTGADWAADKTDVAAGTPVDGKVSVKVTPAEDYVDSPAFFMQVAPKK